MFNWEEYLKLAKYLFDKRKSIKDKNDGTELEVACIRDVISRAYYAAYNTANELCKERKRKSLGYHPDKCKEPYSEDSEHVATAKWFKKQRNKKLSKIGNILADMHGKRKKADYKRREVFTDRDALSVIMSSSEVIKMINNLPGLP